MAEKEKIPEKPKSFIKVVVQENKFDAEVGFAQILLFRDITRFGYTTNTRIKFVIITDASNTTLRDNEIRMMFRHLHSLYASVVCNPFYIPGEKIDSRLFEKGVISLVSGN